MDRLFSRLLSITPLLDYTHPDIEALFSRTGWNKLDPDHRTQAIYEFVRNDIKFGFNAKEPIKASQVLRDGYGQCNTKAILAMALLRRAGIPTRFHVFGIDKSLQAGVHVDFVYQRLPSVLQHSWVEARVNGTWIALEGLILDKSYLQAIKEHFQQHKGPFCGYAIAVDDLHAAPVDRSCQSTFIQKAAIVEDREIVDAPDIYYAKHRSNLQGPKSVLWRLFFQQSTNRRLELIREGVFPDQYESYLAPTHHSYGSRIAAMLDKPVVKDLSISVPRLTHIKTTRL